MEIRTSMTTSKVAYMATAQTTDELCAGCLRDNEEETADLWCNDCAEPVCRNCGKVHRRFTKPHKVINIQDVSSISRSVPNHCFLHPEQKLILFCVKHDKIICRLCLPQCHKECKDVTDIEKAALGIKDNDSFGNLKERIKKLQETVESVKEQNELRLFEVNDEKEKAFNHMRLIRECFDGHLTRIEKQLSTEYDQIVQQITDDRTQVHEVGQMLQNRLGEIDNVVEKNSDCHLFQVIKYLQHIQLSEETITREIKDRTHLELDVFPDDFSTSLDDTFEKLQCRKEKNAHDAENKQNLQESQVHISEKSQFNPRLIESDQNTTFGACCFTEDNRLVVIEFPGKKNTAKSRLKIYNEQQLYGTIPLSFYASDVCMYNKSIALITSRYNIEIAVVNISSLKEGRRITPKSNDRTFRIDYCSFILYCNSPIWTVITGRNLEAGKTVSLMCSLDYNGNILIKIPVENDIHDICYDGNRFYMTHNDRNDITSTSMNNSFYSNIELRERCKIAYFGKEIFLLETESDTLYKLDTKSKTFSLALKDGILNSNHFCLNTKTKQIVITMDKGKSLKVFTI